MFKSLLYNIPYVIVGKAVKNVLTRLTIGDKIALAEDLKLMRNGRFRHSQKVGNIANAHRLAVNGKKNADSGRITEDLEEIRQIVKRSFVGHLSPSPFNYIAVYLLTFTGRKSMLVMLHLMAPLVFYS